MDIYIISISYHVEFRSHDRKFTDTTLFIAVWFRLESIPNVKILLARLLNKEKFCEILLVMKKCFFVQHFFFIGDLYISI